MKDPREREFTCLRLSVTDRCDLRCVYCLPASGLRLGLIELALTTNGQLLAPHAAALNRAGLRRVNVSVDTLKPDLYRRLTRGGELRRTLEGIDSALAAGLAPVRLNIVLLKGWNDDEAADFVRFGLNRGLEVRFLELMPIGRAGAIHRGRFVSMDDVLDRLRGTFRFEMLPRAAGTTSIRYRVSNGGDHTGVVGFVAPVTRPFCAECGRLRLSATGHLRGCLTDREGIDLRPALRAPSEAEAEAGLRAAIAEASLRKPPAPSRQSGEPMSRLGG